MDCEDAGRIVTEDSQWQKHECLIASENGRQDAGDHLLRVIGENEVACTGRYNEDNTVWTYYCGSLDGKNICILECNGMVLNINGDRVGCRKRVIDYNNFKDGEFDVVFEYEPIGEFRELKLKSNPGLYLGFGTNGMPLKPSKVKGSTEQSRLSVYPTSPW